LKTIHLVCKRRSALNLLVCTLGLSLFATSNVCPEKLIGIGIPHVLAAIGTIIMVLFLLLHGFVEPLEDAFTMVNMRTGTSEYDTFVCV
jgi:hypothetical protein